MDVFQEIKQRVNILQVCDLLGIKLNRSRVCLCPFHRESTPSFSVSTRDNIFNCFRLSVKKETASLLFQKC